MTIAKQKQTHRYIKQTSGYQRVQRRGEGQVRVIGLRDKTTLYKIDKQQGYTV